MGRDDSLGALRTALREAASGEPSLVLVSGETGVGKTRLLRELVDTESPTLLYGACVPMAGDPLPFAPLTQALRRLERTGRLNLQLERSPELARLLPGRAPTPTEPGSSPALAAPLGLFQSVLDLIERLAVAGPVLHVVEDVHWADRSTLDLVRFLAHHLTVEPVVLVVTYRADAVASGSPLAQWLAEVGRLERSRRVALERLDTAAATVLVRQLFEAQGHGSPDHPAERQCDRASAGEPDAGPDVKRDDEPDDELVASAVARSAGNPLFAEHLVLEGAGPGSRLPTTLHELLAVRVAGLPAPTRAVLDAAAVLGRAASVTLLSATAGLDPTETERRLVAALEQHVLEVRRDETIGFRHPAFGEVVSAGLLPANRAALHRAAALALEAEAGDPDGQTGPNRSPSLAGPVAPDADRARVIGELARHWLAAGDVRRALDAAVAAGFAAEQMYAFADAQTHFVRAVELMDRAEESTHDRTRLLKHAAQDASLVGDTHEAVRLLETALAGDGAADPDVDADDRGPRAATRAALLIRLGAIHYRGGRGREAEHCFREALHLLPDGEASVLAARAHAGLARLLAAWSRFDEAKRAADLGLAAATTVGAEREAGVIHNALGVIASGRGAHGEAERQLREALRIAHRLDQPDDLSTAYINLSHVLGAAGRVDEVVEVTRRAAQALTRVGLARQSVSIVKANCAEALVDAGRLGEAGEVLGEALQLRARGMMSAPVLTQAGHLALARGDLDAAWERLEQARAVIESENAPDAWLRVVIEAETEVELWRGRPRAAYELAVDGLSLVSGTDEVAAAGTLVALGFRALADLAERHRDPGSRDELEADRGPLDAAARAVGSGGRTDAAVQEWCDAEIDRFERGSDPEAWAAVAALWLGLGRPAQGAYATWREAEARLDAGADAAGIAALRRAHHTAVELGLGSLAAETARLAHWHRLDLAPPAAPAAPDAYAGYGLTAREQEVLRGVAAGQTNQEIADQLFISVKTASVHVSNILRKLDVSGRQEAARVAHRLGGLLARD